MQHALKKPGLGPEGPGVVRPWASVTYPSRSPRPVPGRAKDARVH